jgi:chitinase
MAGHREPSAEGFMPERTLSVGGRQVPRFLYGTAWKEDGAGPSDAALWARVGLTPMIGRNDLPTEVFDQQGAREVLAFAQAVRIGRLSMWSLNRDRPSPSGTSGQAEPGSSGILQGPFEFTQTFLALER